MLRATLARSGWPAAVNGTNSRLNVCAISLQGRGIPMDVMASPENLHGLSYREFGDHTAAFALLSETASAAWADFAAAPIRP